MGNPDTEYILRQAGQAQGKEFWQECPKPGCNHEAFLAYVGTCAIHTTVQMVPQG